MLTLRQINRATLARQNLLERINLPVSNGIAQSIGLQAQRANSPFIALWTRLQDFKREDLAQLIDSRQVVKATSFRATLHLLTRDDYLDFHGAIQPAIVKAQESIVKQRGAEFDEAYVLKNAREFLAEQPRSFAEISTMLEETLPNIDVGAMRYTIRTQLALVQVPVNKDWSYPGNPQFTPAEEWLNTKIPAQVNQHDLILRYLAGFGPATVADFQRFTGLGGQREVFDALKSQLVVYKDEAGRDLYDLPYVLFPAEDIPAPIRFLPEFDNLLLAHDKRARILDDAYRKKVYLPGLRVRATVLVDGFVRGGWEIVTKRGTATLTIELFAPVTASERDAILQEGESLARFIEPDAKAYDVQIME